MVIHDIEKMKIYKHAESEYPGECCGLLLGDKNTMSVCETVPVVNMDQDVDKNTHFSISSLDIYEIEKDADKRGLDVLGFYHSHADHPAILSQEDRKYMIPGCVYMIASVKQGECVELKTYMG